MVRIEFVIDEAELAAAAQAAGADDASLQETYLLMPIRFEVAGQELLRVPDAEAVVLPGPLLHWATLGMDAIESVTTTGRARYSMPGTGGSLSFERRDRSVCITSTLNGVTACAPIDEVLLAARRFRATVRELIETRLPAVTSRPYWSQALTRH